ncbi:bleomycin hydrolase, putative [Talaromyces stipitatus ATCC 10500]|uniref:Cysteine proteinase 1, mitochondrial n=1 Tax=Talaromyces stipitatus (strain ATCC 10500 / CBS 375.48 / QM 6759 / NRRL 1006) TaxID=441959 RepID=B8M661_TALSN|nr:bleomycin hydrolase, putative [Talaromyces stipitatus ATCC 10500]EED19061.1 bleomycin hydrolase, putative [Talaromyces stipitatus ATCC 10500]
MGQSPSKLDEKEAAASMSRRSLDKNAYVFVDDDALPPPYEVSDRVSTISLDQTKRWEEKLLSSARNRLAISALSQNPVSAILTNNNAAVADSQIFNIKIPFEGAPITNQRSSGRCWLFASTNVFRVAIMKKYNLKEFELSQSYLFYWDKIEKANWFLEHAIQTAGEDLEGRLVQALFASPVGDGGQWDFVVNLVNKYGLVPQMLYPDSYNAKNSSKMGSLITTKLREQALVLRKLVATGKTDLIAGHKEYFLQEIHSILTIMLGPPPGPDKEFTWTFYDAENKYTKVVTKPTHFASTLSDKQTVRACGGTDVNELFSLVNDPRNDYNRLLTVDRLGNVVGGVPVRYVNVEMKTIKDAAISMLRAGIPVFFGSDVGKFSDSASGIMDTELFDFDLGFNIKLGLTKEQRLKTGESAMTHAMVLTAVHIENGKPVRWRVQNSWGESAGDKGWFVMTDKWMDEFVYQVVVDPRFVSKETRDVLKQDPVVLPLWDPMGALA